MSGTWSTQQLTEYLAVVSSVPEAATAAREAIERAAEALDAELGVVIQHGEVTASVGFPAALTPEDLLEVAAPGLAHVESPVAGPCSTVTAKLDGDERGWLVVARLADNPFLRADANLLRGMSRVLTLTQRMLDLFEGERALRIETERQANDNARLLESLERQRTLLEQLSKLQGTIASRAPLQRVLDSVVEGARELLGADVSALRLIDANDPSQLITVAASGVSAETVRLTRRCRARGGAAGRAIDDGTAVSIEGYSGRKDAAADFVAENVCTALAVPVHEHGIVVGSIVVGARDSDRRFVSGDREALSAYAEHSSLALAAAKTADTMRHAFNDPLTGLANRALLLDRLTHALARARRDQTQVTLLFIDLDRFKLINDSLGHAAGDALLVAVAERIRSVLRGGETAARLGGDEFAVVLDTTASIRAAESVAQRLLEVLEAPFAVADREVFVSASIGIAAGNDAAEDVLRDSDVAMYRAKSRGKSRYEVYEAGMHEEVVERLELEADLQRALDRDELVVHFQPIVELGYGRIVGLEALVRWLHPTRGLVAPGTFVPIAEETGMIQAIGSWVLAEACRHVARWQEEYPRDAALMLSVNLSGRQLMSPQLTTAVARALSDSRLAPDSLILELTETVLMQDSDATIRQLVALKQLGVKIAVDDFGTGYSSLQYLQRFPIDILKIAKPFVDGLVARVDDTTMVRAIADLGRTLGLGTIAEGIETEDQYVKLRALGCALGQGFLFSKAVPHDAIPGLLFADAQRDRPAA
ncbi:MAG: putative bifunctional diguanylate cyclase/phosphodiesterase [Solirubrobacteraceae bacterium]